MSVPTALCSITVSVSLGDLPCPTPAGYPRVPGPLLEPLGRAPLMCPPLPQAHAQATSPWTPTQPAGAGRASPARAAAPRGGPVVGRLSAGSPGLAPGAAPGPGPPTSGHGIRPLRGLSCPGPRSLRSKRSRDTSAMSPVTSLCPKSLMAAASGPPLRPPHSWALHPLTPQNLASRHLKDPIFPCRALVGTEAVRSTHRGRCPGAGATSLPGGG